MEKLYAECMALEELLEEAVNTLGPDARDILGQIRCRPLVHKLASRMDHDSCPESDSGRDVSGLLTGR